MNNFNDEIFNKKDTNWKVFNVNFKYGDNKVHRLYNELTTDAYFALYNETSHRILDLIEKYGFKVYYLEFVPATDLKIFLYKGDNIDITSQDVQHIKYLQSNDLYYLYMNMFFEVLYLFPKINSNNNYSYNMLITTQPNFDINKVTGHNFNLCKLDKFREILKEEINFNFIENLFNARTYINNCTHELNEFKYDLSSLKLNEDEYIKKYNNGSEEINYGHYKNIESMHFDKNFNQNFYCSTNFKLLCTHIISLDKEYYIEVNKFGETYMYFNNYQMDGVFFTNFFDLADAVSVINENDILIVSDLGNCGTSLSENFHEQSIMSIRCSKEFIFNNFIDFSNKKKRTSHWMIDLDKKQ